MVSAIGLNVLPQLPARHFSCAVFNLICNFVEVTQSCKKALVVSVRICSIAGLYYSSFDARMLRKGLE